MELSRFVFVILLVLGFLLMGCAEPETTPEPIPTDTTAPDVAPPTETTTEVPPTPIPTDTATLVPPTSTPTEKPAPEPSPTWTLIPLGTFKGCLYYDGELVEGAFVIRDSSYDLIPDHELWALTGGCASRRLQAGVYYVTGESIYHPDCRPQRIGGRYCILPEVEVEILQGQVTEVDFPLVAPDRDG